MKRREGMGVREGREGEERREGREEGRERIEGRVRREGWDGHLLLLFLHLDSINLVEVANS